MELGKRDVPDDLVNERVMQIKNKQCSANFQATSREKI